MTNFRKTAIIVFGVVCVLLLLRAGAAIPASVLGFILFATALAERLMRMHYMRKAATGGRQAEKSATKANKMTEEEAREVLGLAADAGAKEIKAAHRRLISKIHPDHGGSEYLAMQLNTARDVLLHKE